MQAMDNSHVALVSVRLDKDGFKSYRCDHAMPLGVNLTSLTKVLKCSKDDDEVTLKAEDSADVLSLKFEAKGAYGHNKFDSSSHSPIVLHSNRGVNKYYFFRH